MATETISEPEVIEGHVESTELEVRTGTVALFGTSDPVEVVEAATRVADALAAVIQAKQLYTTIQRKNHVWVEGWQLLGSMLGVTAVCTQTEPVDGGFRATVEARTMDGRVVGRADALCTKHEKRGPWKGADDYARLSMAQTRATSKALKGPLGFVVSLAGYQTTPAEEMTFAEANGQPEPEPEPPANPLDPERVQTIGQGIGAMGLTYRQIDLMLGACGIDGLRAASGKALRERLESLTPEQADALEAELAKAGDRA